MGLELKSLLFHKNSRSKEYSESKPLLLAALVRCVLYLHVQGKGLNMQLFPVT